MAVHFVSLTFRLLIFLALPLVAQTQPLRFTHLTTDQGLSQSNITSILQDNRGYLWFGTFNGLNRFDGYQFEVFNYADDASGSISHNFISALTLDPDGNLWVGTSEGLNRFDEEKNRFTVYENKPGDPRSIIDDQIEAIWSDANGRLWIGTRNGGLDLFDPQTESFAHHFHDPGDSASLSSNRIATLFEDSDGNLWIGHWNGSVDIYHRTDRLAGQFRVERRRLAGFPITAIVETPDRQVWVGTQGEGIFRLKLENGVVKQTGRYAAGFRGAGEISSDIVLCLMIQNDSTLWIGTEDEGINILNIATNRFQHIQNDPLDQSSLNHDSVWQIFKDRDGHIWIGTFAYGLNLLCGNKSFIRHYNYQPGNATSLSHNMVNALWEDPRGNLWIATDGGGLNYFDRTQNRFIHYNRQNTNSDTDVFVSLLMDSRGRLWVGSWTNGLYRFDPQTGRFSRYTTEKDGLGSNRILNIVENRNGGLWLATFYGGVTYFDPEADSVRVFHSGNSDLSDDFIRVVHQDFQGKLWIGTDKGVDVFDPETRGFTAFKHDLNDPHSLSKGFVHAIAQTRDSVIWIGSTGGLNRFDPSGNRFIHYTVDNGLPNNQIKCIIEDDQGDLWLSTNRGISRFNRASGTFKNYDISDGLQGNEFNARSGWITRAGELVFGGNNGFDLFKPGDLHNNEVAPPVFLTDFKIYNKTVEIGDESGVLAKHISLTREIVLTHRQRFFAIDYVALNYVSPEDNQYAYMMEGIETNWNEVGPQRTASYTNLDPGRYVFRVKAANNDGIWNEAGASLEIVITPPFWRTWWAYLLMATLVITAVFFVVNHYISRQRLENALKIEHLELEKMYELDRLKSQFFSNISHEFHSPLTLILSPLERLIAQGSVGNKNLESLKIIHRSARRLQRMINQLKNIHEIESGDMTLRLSKGDIVVFIRDVCHLFQNYAVDRGIDYQFNPAIKHCVVWFDADKLDKIVYNLLSNAFKFTPVNGRITVELSIFESSSPPGFSDRKDIPLRYIRVVVRDSGIGIPEDKLEHIFERHYRVEADNGESYEGSGIGLALVAELIDLYQGKIAVESAAGKGAAFTVDIPVDEIFLEETQLVGEFSTPEDQQANSYLFPGLDEEGSTMDDNLSNTATSRDMPVVLVVEDDDEIRDFIKTSLQDEYRTFDAANGKAGFAKATELVPDLIISDVKMPGVSGVQLCNHLKQDERTSHIPIILLTAFSSHETKIEGLMEGADVYLTKPFSIVELRVRISNLLQNRQRLKETFLRQMLVEPGRQDSQSQNVNEEFLNRVIETVEKHLSDNKFNAEKLSREIGMSRMQLYRKIRGVTNLTVHEFIRTIRLKKAAQLLQQKRMTITEVAYEVGFNDLTYFARCFRKQYHKSPSEFISG